MTREAYRALRWYVTPPLFSWNIREELAQLDADWSRLSDCCRVIGSAWIHCFRGLSWPCLSETTMTRTRLYGLSCCFVLCKNSRDYYKLYQMVYYLRVLYSDVISGVVVITSGMKVLVKFGGFWCTY